VICDWTRATVLRLYARGMHYDPISRWEGADIEAIGMVYSSRSGRAPRGAASLEVTAAQLFCDAHRVRCAVWRVAADV
jgi:hypothetical protein